MGGNRGRIEFLPEHWQKNPSQKQHQYSSESTCFSESFLRSHGPSVTSSCEPHTRDLRPDPKRPVTSLLEKNWVIFPKRESTEAIQIVWASFLLLLGKVRNWKKASKYGL